MASLSFFNASSVLDGTSVVSHVNLPELVTAVQADSSDVYFDSTSKINTVNVYYGLQGGRQVKKIVHEGPDMTNSVSWSSWARDGTWQKVRVRVFDSDGAMHDIHRAVIGSSEDITHSDGTIFLNTI
jgi:hypothetical protein